VGPESQARPSRQAGLVSMPATANTRHPLTWFIYLALAAGSCSSAFSQTDAVGPAAGEWKCPQGFVWLPQQTVANEVKPSATAVLRTGLVTRSGSQFCVHCQRGEQDDCAAAAGAPAAVLTLLKHSLISSDGCLHMSYDNKASLGVCNGSWRQLTPISRGWPRLPS
jgi:hypothetical protein